MSSGGASVAVRRTERTSDFMLPRYEMRRECQEILPSLYLGPFQASKSLEILTGLNITHMCGLFAT